MTDTLTLNRFEPVTYYDTIEESDHLRGLFVDVETTGLNPDTDKIVQFAAVPFTFTKEGLIGAVRPAYVALEDPGIPIPPELTKIHGITDEMVKGQQISFAEVGKLADVDLVVAHNSEFDRPIVERRFSIFEGTRWGCTWADVPWTDEGFSIAKLEWLAFKHCGMFFDAHRADVDCAFGVHLLSTTLPSGSRVMEFVLAGARATWIRLAAEGSAYETKDLLKARGYRWTGGPSWWIDVRLDQEKAELEWLHENVPCRPRRLYQFDSRTRFSPRIGQPAVRRSA